MRREIALRQAQGERRATTRSRTRRVGLSLSKPRLRVSRHSRTPRSKPPVRWSRSMIPSAWRPVGELWRSRSFSSKGANDFAPPTSRAAVRLRWGCGLAATARQVDAGALLICSWMWAGGSRVTPFQGFGHVLSSIPRGLPWAVGLRPYGALAARPRSAPTGRYSSTRGNAPGREVDVHPGPERA